MFMNSKNDRLLQKALDGNGGVLVVSSAIAEGVPRNAIYDFVKKRELEKASPGIFMDTNEIPDELYLLQARYPKVVFSHDTSLYLHDMSEREPYPISLTVESGYHSDTLSSSGVRIFYVKPEWYGIGIVEVESPGGHTIRIYDKERTVCDIIRRKAAMDPAAYGYALRRYASAKDKDLIRLGRYAKTMSMEGRVQQAMEVLL